MVDNFAFTEGSGKTGAADDIGGVLYPRVKIAQGADGSATDVSSAAPLQVSLANHGANATAVKVDGSAVTQPVSGTVTANLAAGTNNIGDVDIVTVPAPLSTTGGGTEAAALRVTLANDSTGVVSVDDNGGSLTVDGTVAVTGVSTVAEQQTQTTHLATIAGDTTAIETAVQLIDDAIFAEDVPATAADKGIAVLAVRRDADTTLVGADNDYANLQVNVSGALKVEAFSGETLPVSLASVPSHAVTNAGTFAVQVDGATLTALQLIDDAIKTDDAAFTPATDEVMMAGFIADDTATDSVDEGDAGAARITLDRKQIVTNYAHTAGGATPYKLVSAATTNATSVKGSAGQVYMITASSVNAAARYLKLYNKATAPTVGTDTPVHTFIIPGNTAGAGTNIPVPSCGLEFTTGIAFALTTEATDAGTTAVAANEIVVNLAYK